MKKIVAMTAIVALGACVHSPARRAALTQKKFFFMQPPPLVTTPQGQTIAVGGFSGLSVLAHDDRSVEFLTVLDRGPNPQKIGNLRPFAWPEFTPRILRMKIEFASGNVQILEQIILHDSNGKRFSGLPPVSRAEMETAVDLNGRKLKPDPKGLDLEGICRAKDGTLWISDEYGPDLLHFTADGRLLARFGPGSGLPEFLIRRRPNNGFEGVACADDKVYAILQAPFIKGETDVPIVEFDSKRNQVTRVYRYPLSRPKAKIGDLFWQAPDRLLVLEHADQFRAVFEVKVSGEKDELQKSLLVDLAALGFNAEKPEGLAKFADRLGLVVSDNDFGISGPADFSTGQVALDPRRVTEFMLFEFPIESSP